MPIRKRGALALLLGTALVATVTTGCGTTSENAEGKAEPKPCGGAGGKYTIGVSQANVAEPYRERMDADIRQAATAVPQFTVNFADAQQDNSKQVEQVENFITQQVDLLVISPNEASPLTSVVKKAYERGIPVLVLDRKVNGDAYTSFIGADNFDIGRRAGEFVAQTLLPGGGRVAELKGLAGSSPAKERSDGFRFGIGGKAIEVVASADGDWLRDRGRQQADALLKGTPGVQVVYAHNDPMGEGAYLAAQDAGLSGIQIVGIDGLPIEAGGIKAVEAGRLAATFVYPTGGKEAVDSARKILVDCQQVPKVQGLAIERVTKDNAAEVYARLNAGG
ncbi:substrate-binding domain-containing protein [Amycolatopsis magusensis]|uniref:substrate-binding domain-containing protein n=1 Tax=Amycolatopsis magusensis TaxID=882444 RepID=UPI0037B45598